MAFKAPINYNFDMYTVYKEEKKVLKTQKFQDAELEFVEEGSWIHISNPTKDNILKISNLTKISAEFLLCALDEEEAARTDKEDGDSLIVLDTPYVEKHEEGVPYYSTIPFVIVFNDKYYVTICKKKTNLIKDLLKKVKVVEPHKHQRTTLYIISSLATDYIHCLKNINNRMSVIQHKIRGSYKNKELLELMDLNNTFVYFSTALTADKAVLAKLIKSKSYRQFEQDADLMDDTEVEINQAIEMCTVYMEVSSNLMDAFASVINNNMNLTMRVLTIVSIVISIPTLITSIYGMNMINMPLADTSYGFWVVLGLSLALAVIGALLLFFLFNISNKKK